MQCVGGPDGSHFFLRSHQQGLPGSETHPVEEWDLPLIFFFGPVQQYQTILLFLCSTMKLCLLWTALLVMRFAAAQDFPDRFLGHWKGELEWYKTGETAPQQSKMQLIIQPADTAGHYSWQIIYGNDGEDNRPYSLKAVDQTKGHWVIDEKDGIVLDQYWTGNRLQGAFTVQGSTIINSYGIEGDSLMVEFFSLGATPVRKTGSAANETLSVASYPVKSFQKAVLKRVGKGKD